MLEIGKWMEVVQNPETFTESLSFSLCLSPCLPVSEYCEFLFLITLYHRFFFLPSSKSQRQIWEGIMSSVLVHGVYSAGRLFI